MPEMLTKYPDSALKILKDAHLACGEGKTPSILKTCPKDKFCALPTGELCIYDVSEVPRMTQINTFDLIFSPEMILPLLAITLIIFVLGMFAGLTFSKLRGNRLDSRVK